MNEQIRVMKAYRLFVITIDIRPGYNAFSRVFSSYILLRVSDV
jgi:hypothetical protein